MSEPLSEPEHDAHDDRGSDLDTVLSPGHVVPAFIEQLERDLVSLLHQNAAASALNGASSSRQGDGLSASFPIDLSEVSADDGHQQSQVLIYASDSQVVRVGSVTAKWSCFRQ